MTISDYNKTMHKCIKHDEIIYYKYGRSSLRIWMPVRVSINGPSRNVLYSHRATNKTETVMFSRFLSEHFDGAIRSTMVVGFINQFKL